MQENEQVTPVKKPPKWLYGIIYGLGIAIVGMIIAIGYGLIVGFGDKKTQVTADGTVQLIALPVGKKYPDFHIKLNETQQIENVEYADFRVIVYVKDSSNKQNLIIILSATNGNEIGRFVLGE